MQSKLLISALYLTFFFVLINKSIKKEYKKEKLKIQDKEKATRDRFNIKHGYNKINNKKFGKYINKKNINRLLRFKRYHY